jgi:hypothetical protein
MSGLAVRQRVHPVRQRVHAPNGRRVHRLNGHLVNLWRAVVGGCSSSARRCHTLSRPKTWPLKMSPGSAPIVEI